MITIRNLSKVYESQDKKVEALKNINLTINKGEIFGIIGLSGAGKSSLLRCINLLETPTSGEILINGTDITKLRGAELRETRKKIGMIFQHFNLLMNSTVYDNVAFPLRINRVPEAEIEKRVLELLEIVNLSDKKDSYPSQLSGGQKQRVGIARALANNPDIILSDEATSALDPTTTESILSLLKDINKKFGITIVVITHEMDVIKHLCNRVAVIEDGVIVEEGSVIELISNPQASTSKRFLADMIAKLPNPDLIQEHNPTEEVLRISFFGEDANKPFISQMVKQFDVEANIIVGNIESIQDVQVGSLLVKISGSKENIDSAIDFLNNHNLRIEVLKNGSC
ncbi:methionine ABC transporter ATP-binding protein [Fonticella tunisiensis]|uniref:D-methionine transport system ATP-binding protein n=1 Tax=Fonticella tunisiensis TaxID=1096341 RepID=A0A4R7KCR1_9CLOT|nr:methionine ABC transporter ATP-binding protein [Fonticella tunisiensis]TDT52099.1 D-methionine transport system ATP-binding protein [Fonticella tunisiensis]